MLGQKGFFPLGVISKRSSFPMITITLLFLNILIFIFSMLSPEEIFSKFAFVPAFPTILTLFSHMFLHADWMHLLGNMWFLWVFGSHSEDRFGTAKFILIYFFSGIGAILAHSLINPVSTIPLVGASGAISGILGAFIFALPKAKVQVYYGYFFFGKLPSFIYAFVWFAFQLLYGLITLGAGAGIAFFAHIGGFIAGFFLAFVLRTKRKRIRVE